MCTYYIDLLSWSPQILSLVLLWIFPRHEVGLAPVLDDSKLLVFFLKSKLLRFVTVLTFRLSKLSNFRYSKSINPVFPLTEQIFHTKKHLSSSTYVVMD